MTAPAIPAPGTEDAIGMERRSLAALARALDAANVRYLIAGGLAVVAHGYVRYTSDLDLVLDPDPAAMGRAVVELSALGYRPRLPVRFEDLADAGKRAEWAKEKGMMVFSLISPEHDKTNVDVFLECPFDFESAYARALRGATEGGLELTFVPLDELLEMKRRAGRRNDLDDIEKLELLRDEENRR